MNERLRVVLIYGSTREGRFCDKVAEWVAREMAVREEFLVETIDPAASPLPDAFEDSDARFRARIGDADAFIVVTPEYNHGYPAPLKALIDSVGAEWRGKPVAFVSYGGISGGLRAVEQLRLVFAELHTVTMQNSVSFASAWEQFNRDGVLQQSERAERSMAIMLAQLRWWALALREARFKIPYAVTA